MIEALRAAAAAHLKRANRAGKEAQGDENAYAQTCDRLTLARHAAGEVGVIRLKRKWRGS